MSFFWSYKYGKFQICHTMRWMSTERKKQMSLKLRGQWKEEADVIIADSLLNEQVSVKAESALKLINSCHQSSEFVERKEQTSLTAESSSIYYWSYHHFLLCSYHFWLDKSNTFCVFKGHGTFQLGSPVHSVLTDMICLHHVIHKYFNVTLAMPA